jgi:hypothetical protein
MYFRRSVFVRNYIALETKSTVTPSDIIDYWVPKNSDICQSNKAAFHEIDVFNLDI